MGIISLINISSIWMYNLLMVNKIISLLEKNNNIAIFHHKKIDYDSIASSYGLLQVLKKKYPKKNIVWVADFEYIKNNFAWLELNNEDIVNCIDSSYLAIIGDASVSRRIFNYEEFAKAKEKICFDHHNEDVDINFDVMWKETDMWASSVQAYEIIKSLTNKPSNEVALLLILGIVTDTNFFQYSLNNIKPLKAYTELISLIDDKELKHAFTQLKIKKESYLNHNEVVLKSIKTIENVIYSIVNSSDVKFYNEFDSKLLVHTLGNIYKYPIWVLVIENIDKTPSQYSMLIRTNKFNLVPLLKTYNGGGQQTAVTLFIDSMSEVHQVLKYLSNLEWVSNE